jgi:hypothetical protein
LSVTSIDELRYRWNSLNLYPNPTGQTSRLSFDFQEGDIIQVFNSAGQVVQQYTTQQQSDQSLDVSGLSPGIYMVTLNSKGQLLSGKLVVE